MANGQTACNVWGLWGGWGGLGVGRKARVRLRAVCEGAPTLCKELHLSYPSTRLNTNTQTYRQRAEAEARRRAASSLASGDQTPHVVVIAHMQWILGQRLQRAFAQHTAPAQVPGRCVRASGARLSSRSKARNLLELLERLLPTIEPAPNLPRGVARHLFLLAEAAP